jgi:hypothetical protein
MLYYWPVPASQPLPTKYFYATKAQSCLNFDVIQRVSVDAHR